MSDSMPTLECLTQEIQQIPSAQWNNLLELLKIFRQSVNPPQTLKSPDRQSSSPRPTAIVARRRQ